MEATVERLLDPAPSSLRTPASDKPRISAPARSPADALAHRPIRAVRPVGRALVSALNTHS